MKILKTSSIGDVVSATIRNLGQGSVSPEMIVAWKKASFKRLGLENMSERDPSAMKRHWAENQLAEAEAEEKQAMLLIFDQLGKKPVSNNLSHMTLELIKAGVPDAPGLEQLERQWSAEMGFGQWPQANPSGGAKP